MDDLAVKHELWRRGILQWKLREYQKPIYLAAQKTTAVQFMLNCSRRLGKTTVCIIMALELALKEKDQMIQFTTSTSKAMRGIVRPIFNQMMEDCPEELKPQWKGNDDYYYFPSTGSEIHLAGSNNGHEDDSRGRRRNLCVVDEGQSIDRLQYLIDSVLSPQTIDQPGGKIIIAGTPPESPAHYYKTLYQKLKIKGDVQEYNIYTNTNLTPDILEKYISEAGGEDSTTFQREYLVKFVVDSERAIIPDWDTEKFVQELTKDELYHLWHKYVSMDIGGTDLTAILYAYYNFREAKLYIESEWSMAGSSMTTDLIKDEITATEKKLWGSVQPWRRVADNNNKILLNDLAINHATYFQATSKDNLHAMVNKVREWVKTGRIVVDPSCTLLIGSLEAGIWDNARKQFDRMGEFGHFDMLATLVYLVRNIDEYTNPVPDFYQKTEDKFYLPETSRQPRSDSAKTLNNVFGVKRKGQK